MCFQATDLCTKKAGTSNPKAVRTAGVIKTSLRLRRSIVTVANAFANNCAIQIIAADCFGVREDPASAKNFVV